MYKRLKNITSRPKVFEHCDAKKLWGDEHVSKQMLVHHLSSGDDIASRRFTLIDKTVAFLSAKLVIKPGASLIDYGCGPGLYTQRFARRGVKVTGVDFSKRSLNYARQQARKERLDINYVEANYLKYKPKRPFDVATLIYCDFCALSPAQRKILLSNIRRSLKEGGALVMDVGSKVAFKKREEGLVFDKNLHDGFWSAKDYYGFAQNFVYQKECVVLDKYTIIEDRRVKTVYNWLEYFDRAKLVKELAANGFKVINSYSDLTGRKFSSSSDEFAVIAKKR